MAQAEDQLRAMWYKDINELSRTLPHGLPSDSSIAVLRLESGAAAANCAPQTLPPCEMTHALFLNEKLSPLREHMPVILALRSPF